MCSASVTMRYYALPVCDHALLLKLRDTGCRKPHSAGGDASPAVRAHKATALEHSVHTKQRRLNTACTHSNGACLNTAVECFQTRCVLILVFFFWKFFTYMQRRGLAYSEQSLLG